MASPVGRRFFLGGSGKDMMGAPQVIGTILEMIPPGRVSGRKPLVLYLGTATYDSVGPRKGQADTWLLHGVDVKMLCCTRGLLQDVRVFDCLGGSTEAPADGAAPAASGGGDNISHLDDAAEDSTARLDAAAHPGSGENSLEELIAEKADVILVSGGNTLFAVDRWIQLGFLPWLQAAEARGAVLCGGSAGAICWCTSGHSDSADPASWLATAEGNATHGAHEEKTWQYIRIPALGLLPGLLIPHGDKVQSNGVLRSDDADTMLRRLWARDQGNERALQVDHWAALKICGDRFEVFSLEGKEGSVLPDGTFSRERAGSPGVWTKEIGEGSEADGECAILSTLVPSEGLVQDLFPGGRKEVGDDETVAECRRRNPA